MTGIITVTVRHGPRWQQCRAATARRRQARVGCLAVGRFFGRVYGGNSFPTKKPDPEGAQTILREMATEPKHTLIVGDSGVDVLTGRNAGMWTCGVTYGFAPHTLHDPAPDVLADKPYELAELFASLEKF